VLEYQMKYEEAKRAKKESALNKTNEEYKARVADLENLLLDLRKQNENLKAKKDPDLSQYTKKMEELQSSVLEYQEKYETVRKKHMQLVNQQQASSKKDQTAQLTEQVQNLTFHLYYGASDKDKEIEALKAKTEGNDADTTQVTRLRKKYGKMRDRAVEEWLFSGDIAEAL